MMLKKYLPAWLLLFVAHLFLDTWLLVVTWCALGVVFALWQRETRFPLLSIVVMEVFTGLLFWLIFWAGNDSLAQLSARFGIAPVMLPASAIAVNVVSAILCAAPCFYITEEWLASSRRKRAAKVKSRNAVIQNSYETI